MLIAHEKFHEKNGSFFETPYIDVETARILRLRTEYGERAYSHAGPAACNSCCSQPCHVQETTQNALFNTAFSTC